MQSSAETLILAEIERMEEVIKELRKSLKTLKGTGHSTVPQNGRNPARSAGKGGPQLRSLKEFVKEHGPLRRKDIIKKSGIPIGTISSNLKKNNGFRKDAMKHWYVPKSEKGGDSE